MSFSDINLFDIIVGVIFLLLVVRGGWTGFVRQLATFFALIGGYLLAGRYSGQAMVFIEPFVDNPKLVFLISFALLFCLTALVFISLGSLVQKLVDISMLGWFDRLLGMFLGGAKAWVACSFLYMFLASSLSGSNALLNQSISGSYLAEGGKILNQFIRDPDIQKHFVPNKPAIPAEKPEPGSEGR
jgi:membrane protein required for colicin V production